MGLLKPELISLSISGATSSEVLRSMAARFVDHGYARESYPDGIVAREEVFPTALPTEVCDIAIPHCNREHVLAPAIGVGLLDQPVAFRQMASPEIILHPRILFMLAIDRPESQLETLMKLMEVLQSPGLLERIRYAPSVQNLFDALNPALSEMPGA